MLSDRLTRGFSRVLLATYITHLLAPVVHATERGDVAVLSPMGSLTKQEIRNSMKAEVDKINRLSLKSKAFKSSSESQPIKIPSPLKSEAGTSSPSLEPYQQLPTLSVQLDRLSQEAKGNGYRLSIERTNPVKSGDTFTNFQWQKDFFFASLKDHKASSSPRNHAVYFPLMGSLNLNLSDTGQLTAFSTIDSSGSYQAYNYHFYLSTDLHLVNLMTNGQIDVKRAYVVSAEGEVYGQEGIFLKGKQEIRTRTKDSQHPTHLHSKKRINLKAPYLDNENSCIHASLIEGTLGRRGQRGASLDNTKGMIEATDLLSLTLATEAFNEGGVLNASSGKTKVSTFESFFNTKGFVGGKHGLDLMVKGRLQNPGGKLRSEETAAVKAGSWTHTNGAEAFAKDLKIIHTHFTTDETSRLGADDLLHFSLPPTQQAVIYPIYTLGRLELERDGKFSEPLHLMADLLALKGLKVRVPSAPLLVGVETEAHRPIKLQAKKGFLETQSKSLDLIKAQLFSKTGMHWEVQEKQIHIGRGVETIKPITLSLDVWQGSGKNPPGCIAGLGFIRELRCFVTSFEPRTIAGLYGTGVFNLPYEESNGTSVVTNALSIISPMEVLIDQAEVNIGQKCHIITNTPVINRGGKITVKEKLHIESLEKKGTASESCLQNIMDSKRIVGSAPYLYLIYSGTRAGEVVIGGDLDVDNIDVIGSLLHVGGNYLGKNTPTQKDFLPEISALLVGGGKGIKESYPSSISIAKKVIIENAKNPVLEGVLQAPLIIVGFEGKATVGRMANYQRHATPPFQQMKMFMDVHRPTALFRPVMDASTPWINQPTVPLSWKVQLPPAVGLSPQGLYLLDSTEKLLLHPLQEVGDLPSVFAAQLRRGYLDEDHPDALATYVMGRHQAYNLYLKFFAPKALEAVAQDHTPTDNPERALKALDTSLAHTMTEEEVNQLKFMMLYYGMSYEGKTVHLPVSWLSKHYDDPRIRNPDGGVFGKIVVFKGETPDSVLHCASTIHGENLLGVDVPLTILERQSHQYITYHANTVTKKGSWWRGGSSHTEIVAVHHNTAQPNTGNMTTGKNGQIAVKSKQFELKNGAHMDVGAKGLAVDIDQLIASPAVQAALGYSQSSAGGTSVTQHYPVYTIQPASVTSDGGIKGRIGKMKLDATHMIAFDKDINLNGQEAHLLAHRVIQNLGTMVTKEGRVVTVTEKSKEIAMPCVFKAHKGNVLLHFEDRLRGEATQFLAEKKIDLNSKDIDIETLLMKIITRSTSTTQGMFSKQTTDIYQESPDVAQSLFMADEVHFRGQQAKVSGAYIKTSKIFDRTTKGLGMHSTIKQFYSRQETTSSQPLASSKVGMEAGQDVRIPTTVDADAIIRLPEGHVLLADGTIHRVQQIPGDDNACGFASLLWNLPNFDPLRAREIGVDLLLEHLNDATFQTQICNLIAPEIKEWALVDSEELATFPDVDSVIPRIRQAQEDVTKAVRTLNSLLNLKVALTAKKLLAEAKELQTDNPNAALIFAPLRQAQEKLEAAKAEIVAWANDPDIVREYVRTVVGQPGWMLGYGSEYDGSPGAMDALALTLGVNLHVYRDKEGGVTLVHAHETRPHASLVELLHTAYRPKESTFANHFNRLEPFNPSADMGKMIFEDTVIDEDVTKIIGNYEKTHIELTNWSRSWAEHHQVIPPEALVVVALAVALATQGVGVKFLAPMLNGITAASGMQLSAMGVAMVNAGFTTVCSSALTSGLQTGDLAQVGKNLTSPEGVRALGISMLSAGLCHQIGGVLKIDTNPSLKEVLNPKGGKPIFMDFLKSQALKTGVNAGLNVTIGRESASEAMVKAVKEAPLNAVAAWASYNIGDAGFQGKITPEEQDVVHSIVGAAIGAVQNPDKPLEGAVVGGANAFVAARASKMMFGDREEIKAQAEKKVREQGLPITEENTNSTANDILHKKTVITQILAASGTAFITRDPGLTSTGISVATNVIENNCIPSMTKSILVSEGCKYPEKDVKEGFWQDEYADPDDLYLEMMADGVKERERPSYLQIQEKELDEKIKDTEDALKNKKLGVFEKFARHQDLSMMREQQERIKVVKFITKAAEPLLTLTEAGIKNSVRGIKEFRRDHPTAARYWDQGIYGIGKGAQYSAYGWTYVSGYSVGVGSAILTTGPAAIFTGPVAGHTVGSLALAGVISLEAPLGTFCQYGIGKLSMDAQELTGEILSLLPLLGIRGVRGTGLSGINSSAIQGGVKSTPLSLTYTAAYSAPQRLVLGKGAHISGTKTTTTAFFEMMSLRGEAQITSKIFAFAHNEQGAGRGFWKKTPDVNRFNRAITPKDCGMPAHTIQDLTGYLSLQRGVLTASFDIIEASASHISHHPVKIINNLKEMAQATGAKTLRIEWNDIINPKLEKTLLKHYTVEKDIVLRNGWIPLEQQVITIPLKTQSPANISAKVLKTMSQSRLEKITDKISAFMRDEQGAGKGLGKETQAASMQNICEQIRSSLSKQQQIELIGTRFIYRGAARLPTLEEFNPRILEVRAGDLFQTITKIKHDIRPSQAAPLHRWNNEKLAHFQVEDPISATLNQINGGGLSLTNGHHRSAEIINRVNSGEMSPDTIIRILVHD